MGGMHSLQLSHLGQLLYSPAQNTQSTRLFMVVKGPSCKMESRSVSLFAVWLSAASIKLSTLRRRFLKSVASNPPKGSRFDVDAAEQESSSAEKKGSSAFFITSARLKLPTLVTLWKRGAARVQHSRTLAEKAARQRKCKKEARCVRTSVRACFVFLCSVVRSRFAGHRPIRHAFGQIATPTSVWICSLWLCRAGRLCFALI